MKSLQNLLSLAHPQSFLRSVGWNTLGRSCAVAVAVVLIMMTKAQAAVVSYDVATNKVDFSPSDIVEPVIMAVIAAITASVALYVVWTGMRWLFKVIGVKRG